MAATTHQAEQAASDVVDAIVGAYEAGRFDELEARVAESFVLHPGGGARLEGFGPYRERIEATREAFPDFRKRVDTMLVDGGHVAVRYVWSGTHEGEFAGMAATGNHVEVSSRTLMTLADGKLTELYIYGDGADLTRQLSE